MAIGFFSMSSQKPHRTASASNGVALYIVAIPMRREVPQTSTVEIDANQSDRVEKFDHDGHDQALCLGCPHLGNGTPPTCNQGRSADLGGTDGPVEMVTLLQRCDGFKEMTR